MRFSRIQAAILVGMLICALSVAHAIPPPVQHESHIAETDGNIFTLNIPRGYALRLLTTDMQRPRLFIYDQAGNMLVGSRSGNIYRLKPPYSKPEVMLSLADYPHSLALRGKYLYIAQTAGLYRIEYRPADSTLSDDDVEQVVAIPGGWGHNSRTLKVGPDNRLYVSLGIAGNCSDQYLHESYPQNNRRGGVMVLDETTSPPVWKTWASGLRNPVGFDWHPDTRVMYASNNGPDHQGYEQPPEYFSRLDRGSFHGMPWFQYNGKQLLRDDCVTSKPPRMDAKAPVATFPARNAPMDVYFIHQGHLDRKYHGDAVVALHGSWGTQPDGDSGGHPSSRRPPALVLVRFEQGKVVRVDDLVSGFQNVRGNRFARPMGLGTGPDGNLYMTSDGGINGLFRLEKIMP
ncbi:MAG: PQQ-dependent sugar dehydrogenase [Gammaproteobacteria bacterium]|nr:PQQ-dependent sugar dehydrogenase [Gammaproteobacteria bacterium]